MKQLKYGLILCFVGLMFIDCASEKVSYDLPSAHSKQKPTWVGTQKAARDTIFIVVNIPRSSTKMNGQVQEAQSALHTILVEELDVIISEYWLQKGVNLTDDERFTALAGLPMTLESVMRHVSVTDGWENEKQRSFLCALDYEDVSNEIMMDLSIEDIAFRSYLKRRMDELSKKYR